MSEMTNLEKMETMRKTLIDGAKYCVIVERLCGRLEHHCERYANKINNVQWMADDLCTNRCNNRLEKINEIVGAIHELEVMADNIMKEYGDELDV